MYKKILVPVDGSENSFRSLEHAAQLAQITGARLTLFHVIAPLPASIQRYAHANYLIKEVQDFGQEIIENAKESIAVYNLEVETGMIYGDPAHEIIHKAKEEDFDLIVIGSRGLNPLTSIIMGSVSSRVARQANCPVLVVR